MAFGFDESRAHPAPSLAERTGNLYPGMCSTQNRRYLAAEGSALVAGLAAASLTSYGLSLSEMGNLENVIATYAANNIAFFAVRKAVHNRLGEGAHSFSTYPRSLLASDVVSVLIAAVGGYLHYHMLEKGFDPGLAPLAGYAFSSFASTGVRQAMNWYNGHFSLEPVARGCTSLAQRFAGKH